MKAITKEQLREKKEDRVALGRLFADFKKLRLFLAVEIICTLCIIACNALSPKLLGNIIGKIDAFSLTDKSNKTQFLHGLYTPLVLLLSVYAAYAIFSWVKTLLANYTMTKKFTCGLRVRMSEKITRLPVSYLDKTTTGEILSRMQNNVGNIGGTVNEAMDVLMMGVLQIVVIGVMLFLESPVIACVVVVLAPISAIVSVLIAKASMKYFDKLWTHYEKLYSAVEETYSGVSTVKNFNMEESVFDKHAKINREIMETGNKAYFLSSLVQPIISVVNHLSFVAVCLLGGYLASKGRMDVATVVTVVMYSKNFSSPLMQIANGLSSIQQVGSSAKKVYGFLDEKEMQEETQEISTPVSGDVEFKDVCFSYTPDKPIIEHLHFSAKAGEKIAIVGPTGGGKTTIVNLLMRFYDPDKGEILLDNQPIEKLSASSVRDNFAMVLQDTWLFDGTVYENVAYGKENATREEVERACKAAYCDGFISKLEKGYDTVLTDTTALSGGQKQLLTIARAFLADKPLLILDEATSGVDTRTELLVQKAMDRLTKDKTCFIIAHRLSTIVNADKIVAVDKGKTVDVGKHKELLEKGGFYANLWNSQYSL